MSLNNFQTQYIYLCFFVFLITIAFKGLYYIMSHIGVLAVQKVNVFTSENSVARTVRKRKTSPSVNTPPTRGNTLTYIFIEYEPAYLFVILSRDCIISVSFVRTTFLFYTYKINIMYNMCRTLQRHRSFRYF